MVWRWLWPLWLWSATASGALREQRFAMEPQDQTAVVGTRVTFPCRVINKSGILQWTKDGFGLGTHRNLSGFDRYFMIGSDEEGDYSLDIFPVKLEDDASFQCQVGTGSRGEPPVRSRVAHLSVLMAPERPKITQGEFMLTTEDREIELECVSSGGKPPSEITWIDGLGNVVTEGIEVVIERMPDNPRRFVTRSILKLTPKKEHHNTTFVCQAQNAADRSYRFTKLTLDVKYAPKVTVSVVGGGSRLVEGQDVRLSCSADANPADVTYRWFIDDQLVPGDPTTELVLTNVTRGSHDAIVKCEVHNAVGKSEESEALDIAYAPRFRSRPTSVQADVGSSVTLSCDVDGNPPPEIVWIHEDTGRRGNVLKFTWEQVVSTSPNLTLTVAQETAGRYFCRATVPGFPDIGAEATVYQKGPPTIISHRIQFGIPGDNVRLDCSAFSIPAPQKVVWSFHGEDVGSDQDYSVLEDPLTEGIKSTLIIRESKPEHFGVYNCTVSNAYGSDVVEITLKPQKSFPLLLVLTGVLGGVVVIVAITMVVILCQRKVKKPQVDNLDVDKQCKESDRSSNISDMKLELRTGSSVSNVHCELDYSAGPESETGSESVVTRVGVGGGGTADHRYSQRYSSADFPEPVFPPKNDGQNNNGYVPYVDYTRDYNPPALTLPTSGAAPVHLPPANGGVGALAEPRYATAFVANPYLRSPQPLPLPANNPLAPPPPPYSALRNGAAPQVSRLPTSPTPQYITAQQATIKRGTLATHV